VVPNETQGVFGVIKPSYAILQIHCNSMTTEMDEDVTPNQSQSLNECAGAQWSS